MASWLVKTEPSDYPFEQLLKDKRAPWTGVKNAQARIHLRAMKKGDDVLVYHTGDVKAVVGLAKVIREPYPDPTLKEDDKAVAVDLQAVQALTTPVPLSAIKADKRFAAWGLVTIGRLSVVPTPAEIFHAILALSR